MSDGSREAPASDVDAWLGQALVEQGVLEQAQIDACMADSETFRGQTTRLSHALLASGTISASQLSDALQRVQVSAADPAAPELGHFDKYRIVGKIGQGGMGVIYEAEDVVLGRRLVLKVMRSDSAGEDDLVRFHREGALASRLGHPSIINVHDVGVTLSPQTGEPVHYLAMDLIDGEGDLGQVRGALSREEQIEILAQVCEAVGFAHERGVVHRDLKPANVLLDRERRPIVTDFGLARSLSDDATRVTQTGQMMGTPYTMAPEQALGELHRIGPPADVWALGVMLFEILADEPPFSGVTLPDLFMRIVEDEPRFAPAVQRSTPADLRTICLQALAKAPGERYPDAAAMGADLRRYQAGEEIAARKSSLVGRVRRSIRRRRGVIAAVLIGAGLVGVLSASMLQKATMHWAATSIFREVQAQAQDRMLAKANPAQRVLGGLVRQVEHGDLPIERAALRGESVGDDPLVREMLETMTTWEWFGWVSYSSAEGDLVGVYRAPGSPSLWLHKSWQEDGRSVSAGFVRYEGRWRRSAEPPFQASPDYDPRTRPFYRSAASAEGARWLEPYVFWQSFPGLTCATALREGGEVRGVMTVDFEIWAISGVLRQLRVDNGEQSFVGTVALATRDGAVVAHSDPGVVRSPEQLTVGENNDARIRQLHEIGDPLLSALAEHCSLAQLLEADERVTTIRHGDKRYLVNARPQAVAGLDLVSVVVIPEEQIAPRRRWGAVMLCGQLLAWTLLLLGAAIGLWAWRLRRR